jgi:hypothetical protein
MLVRFQEPIYINRLRRFAMKRWQIAAANLHATSGQSIAIFMLAHHREARWFATVDRLTRLYRQTANS